MPLIMGRKVGEKIVIADEIEITITQIAPNFVRFSIKAPERIPIFTKLKGNESPEAIAAERAKKT